MHPHPAIITPAAAALLVGLLTMSACTQHKVEVSPTHHTIEVQPIRMTIDINIRVQQELEKFFEPIEPDDPTEADQTGETEDNNTDAARTQAPAPTPNASKGQS